MSIILDCGDNSCHFAPRENRGGMRTNGGCQCFRNAGYRSTINAAYQMLPELLALRAKLREVPWTEEEAEKAANDHADRFQFTNNTDGEILYASYIDGIIWAEKRIKERKI